MGLPESVVSSKLKEMKECGMIGTCARRSRESFNDPDEQVERNTEQGLISESEESHD